MSRLCRLKTRSHGDDGKWAYEEIKSLRAELAKYRDAPVVAYQHRDGMLSCRLPGGGVPGIDWAPLIVKPGEEK